MAHFVIFAGQAGTVTAQSTAGAIAAGGMQFATDGYLIGRGRDSTGHRQRGRAHHPRGSGVTATVASELRGTQGLHKTDFWRTCAHGQQQLHRCHHGIRRRAATWRWRYKRQHQRRRDRRQPCYGQGTLAIDRSNELVLPGAISGGGRVVQNGEGATVFAGNNTFSGGLTVEKGTARAGIANSLRLGPLRVQAGATADLAGFNTTVGGLAGAGDVKLGQGTLTLEQNIGSLYSGVMSGKGGLTQNGSGRLTLAGANAMPAPPPSTTARSFKGPKAHSVLRPPTAWAGMARCNWAASTRAWRRSTTEAASHLAAAAVPRSR